MKRYRCTACDHIYDSAAGDPDTGIRPGTPFEKLPADWFCPECGAAKADFEVMDGAHPRRALGELRRSGGEVRVLRRHMPLEIRVA